MLTTGLATLLLTSPAFAQSIIPNPIPTPIPIVRTYPTYYGNALVTGSQGCSIVQGTFPATASVNGSYYINILIQNPPIGLPLQFLSLIVGPSPSFTVFDPQLFGSSTLQVGTYSGQPSISGNVLTLGTETSPLLLQQTVTTTTPPIPQPCVLSITGSLYYSPG
jgi:hypothetical protein